MGRYINNNKGIYILQIEKMRKREIENFTLKLEKNSGIIEKN